MASRSKRSKRSGRAASAAPARRRPEITWWERLPGATQHGICLGVLVVVAVGFYAPMLFSDKGLVAHDIVQWRAMAESMIEYREATGEEPLWDPNAFAGMPGYQISYERQVPQIDAIPRWLRTFAWPVSHFIFLLVGTYLLVVFLTKDKLSAVLAACAYGLTTYLPIILVAGHNTKFIALCLAPWVVLAFAYALRRPGPLAGLLFAVALAADLQANHVQITYYVAFLLGVWWIVEAVGAVRRGAVGPFAVATGWLALGAVLAVLMVADPYLSTYEYKAYSIRGASSGGGEGGLDWTYAMRWSQGVGELVTLLVSDAFGGGGGSYWGPKTLGTAGPHYVGGIVLLLAGLALWRYRRPAVWGLGLSALLMILFSLGEHLPILNRFMFSYFPLFDAFRVPETWLSVTAMILAVLAGLGLYDVVRTEQEAEVRAAKTRAVYVASGVALGLTALLLVGKTVFFDFERPGEYEQVVQQIVAGNNVEATDPRVAQTAERFIAELKVDRVDRFTADAVRTLLVLLLAAGLLIAFRKGKLPGWAVQGAFVVLVVIDLGGVGRRYFNADRLVPSQDPESQIRTFDFDRFILERQDEAGGPGHFRVLSLEGDPFVNARPSYHYESLGGYHAARLRVYQDYLDHLLVDARTGGLSDNALDLLSTRFIVASGTVPGMEVVYRSEETGLLVLENPDALPRAFFVGETEVVPTLEELWARIQSETFDPRRTALLSESVEFTPAPLDSTATVTVRQERFSPREIAWQVETDAPRLLVVGEIYYPAGWQATVDGEPAPIYRADHVLRAVPVPAGAHEVVMRFAPTGRRLSLWASGLSTALVYVGVLALLGLAWRRREATASADDGTPADTEPS